MADQSKKPSKAPGKAAKGRAVVKKVRAYPIAATMEFKSIKKQIQIMKLATVGAWTSLGNTVVQVGVVYNLDFELPVSHDQVITPAKALRTMDRVHERDGAKAIERLAEFQFIKPTADTLEKIRRFLAAINQPD